MYALQTLGAIDLRDGDSRPVPAILAQPQLLALLVYLACEGRGAYQRRDRLLDLMWPEASESQARHRLNQALYELRRALGEDVVVSRGKDAVGIQEASLRADVHEFRVALRDGRREDALRSYKGEFLGGFYASNAPGLDRWIDEERGHLRREALDAASSLIGESRERGDLSAALDWARRAREIDPQSEPALRGLMSLLRLTGDRTRAIEVFEHFRRELADAFEMEPSRETLALAEQIRSDGGGRTPSPAGSVVAPAGAVPTAAGPASTGSRQSTHPRTGTSRGQPAIPNMGRTLAGAGIALLGFAAVLWAILSSANDAIPGIPGSAGARPVVVVLPVAVEGSVPGDLGDLGPALTRELNSRLARSPEILLVPTDIVEEYVDGARTRDEIGRALTADVVVDASLAWTDAEALSVAEVVDVAANRVIWEIEHRHAPQDLLQAQRDITVGVASALGVEALTQVPPRMPSEAELNAWAYVEQARQIINSRPLGQSGHDRVAVLLGRALEIAPDYAPAHAARANAFLERLRENPRGVAWQDSARAAAELGVALDPDDYRTQSALANALGYASREAPTRELQLRRFEASLRAIQLNPSDPEVQLLLAQEWMGVGRNLLWGDRSRILRRFFDRMYFYRGHWFWLLGDYDASLSAYAQLVELRPGRPGYEVFRVPEVHLSRGDVASARRSIRALFIERPDPRNGAGRTPLWTRGYPTAVYLELMEGDYAAAERLLLQLLERDRPITGIGTSNFSVPTALAYVYLKTGRADVARELVEEERGWLLDRVSRSGTYLERYTLAQQDAMFGDADAAVGWIEEAVERGWIWYYTLMGPTDPLLENIHDDPRFIEQMEQVKSMLDAERAWVHEMMSLPEPERFRRMVRDAEEKLAALWASEG